MQISDFPRPPEDNGRGIHWSAQVYHPTGRDLDFWINELTTMHIKWVKLLDDGSGSSLELCRRLLDAGIMPVVRLFRQQPNPARLSGREISGLRKLTAAGVRYFETNNEPDLDSEWQDNHRPANWLDVVVEHFIYDADVVLKEGGLPAVPAIAHGGSDNIIRRVADQGRDDLFKNGAWLAIHNYTRNRPLDYPDDPVNQEGKLLTQQEFEALPAWAWDNRSLEMVNEERARNKPPDQITDQNAYCFREWEWAGKLVHNVLGYYLPVLSTEGGPAVGRSDDRRYSKVTPSQQAQWQVEIVRFLQERAPDWYFTCCTWLLASRLLGDWHPLREQMSWYTDVWNERFDLAGQLPVVQALKDLQPQTRSELRQRAASVVLTLIGAGHSDPLPDRQVEIEAATIDAPVHRFQGRSDAQGRLTLEQLSAGSYRVLVFNTEVDRITLNPGERKESSVQIQAGRQSSVQGQITDDNGIPQPDLPVTLQQASPPRLLAETRSDAHGHYRFGELPSGKVTVWVAPGTQQSTERRNVTLDGWKAVTVDITVPSIAHRRYEVVEQRLLTPAETDAGNLILGYIFDENGEPLDGVTVRMRWAGAGSETLFPTIKSGQNQSKPRGYFEFSHPPGVFMIDILEPEVESEVAEDLVTANMPGRSRPISYEVNFQRRLAIQKDTQSRVQGRVLGGPPNLTVTLIGTGIEPRLLRLNDNGSFHFDELPAGIYQLSLLCIGVIADDIILDGVSTTTIEFPMAGQITGRVLPPDQPATIVLTCERYSLRQEDDIDERGEYRFEHLPEDSYTLRLKNSGLPSQALICDGRQAIAGPTFDRELNKQSVISGRITDHQGGSEATTILWLRTLGQRVRETQTDAEGRYLFQELGAGTYSLELVGTGLIADNLRINGTNTVTQDIQLPPPPQCVIEGRLLDEKEQPVANRTLLLDGSLNRQTSSGEDGSFRFVDLTTGDYVVRVADVPSVKAILSFDTAERKTVTFHLPTASADIATPLSHYLFITTPDPDMAASQLAVAQDYILRKLPTVGFHPQECIRARQVTIIGAADSALVQRLHTRNILVQQVSGKLETLRTELETLS